MKNGYRGVAVMNMVDLNQLRGSLHCSFDAVNTPRNKVINVTSINGKRRSNADDNVMSLPLNDDDANLSYSTTNENKCK